MFPKYTQPACSAWGAEGGGGVGGGENFGGPEVLWGGLPQAHAFN